MRTLAKTLCVVAAMTFMLSLMGCKKEEPATPATPPADNAGDTGGATED